MPSDIAKACLFLGSDLSSYVNGADLAVHGRRRVPGPLHGDAGQLSPDVKTAAGA